MALGAIYLKLVDARNESESNLLKPLEWLKLQCASSEMCNYWYLIIKLQINILLFIRSIRESNFPLYVLSLQKLVKWMFALDHYNCARWINVHLFDLRTLRTTCPDIYESFTEGKFSFQKNIRVFLKIAIDQVHEQNNNLIKNNGGATHLLNNGGATHLLNNGGATHLLNNGGATHLLNNGGATHLLNNGGATHLLNNGGATHLLNNGGATHLLNNGGATHLLNNGK